MLLQFNTYYHIYNHANGDDNLFREQKNYPFFLEKYHKHIDPIAETIAWCLMPNHFHLLVKIRSEEKIISSSTTTTSSTFLKFKTLEKFEEEEEKSKFLSKQFSNFFSSYSQAFNKVYNRRGSLFIKNFKRKEITNDDYLRNLILYIHLNPVKHGFTKTINDWVHTSFSTLPVSNNPLITSVFGSETNYHLMHQNKQTHFNEYDSLENELT